MTIHSIQDYLSLARNKKAADAMVNQTIQRMSSTGRKFEDGYPDPALNEFCYPQSFPSLDLLYYKYQRVTPVLGNIVGIDQQIPTRKGSLNLTEQYLGSIKFGQAAALTEEDYDAIYRFEKTMGSQNPIFLDLLREFYFKKPVLLAAGVINIMYLLCYRVMAMGKADYTDIDTKLSANVDYTGQIPAGNLFAPLAGANQWTAANRATAAGITDIVALQRQQFQSTQTFAPYVVMDRLSAQNLREQDDTKERVGYYKNWYTSMATGIDAASIKTPSIMDVSETISNELLGTGGFTGETKIIVTDAVYYRQGVDGTLETFSGTPFWPDGYVALAWPKQIVGAMLPVASNNYATNSISINVGRDWRPDPKREVITATTRGIPMLADERLICSIKVR